MDPKRPKFDKPFDSEYTNATWALAQESKEKEPSFPSRTAKEVECRAPAALAREATVQGKIGTMQC